LPTLIKIGDFADIESFEIGDFADISHLQGIAILQLYLCDKFI